MKDGTLVVEFKGVRFDEESGPTGAHTNDNVIDFDPSDANILVDDLQAAHDGVTEHEDIRNENGRTDNTNEGDRDDAPVDDKGKNEGEQSDIISAE